MAEAERFKAAGTGPLTLGAGAPTLGQPMAVPVAADPTQNVAVPRMDAQPVAQPAPQPTAQGNPIQMSGGQPGGSPAVPGAPRAFQPAGGAAQAGPLQPVQRPVTMAQPAAAPVAAPAAAPLAPAQPGASPMTPGGAQRPFMNRQAPVAPQAQSLGGEAVYKVSQMGTAPDGTPLVAEFDAVFPAGTSLNGGPTVRRV